MTLQPIESHGNIEKLVIHIRQCKRSLSTKKEKEIVPGSQPAILRPALGHLSLQELGALKVRRGKKDPTLSLSTHKTVGTLLRHQMWSTKQCSP